MTQKQVKKQQAAQTIAWKEEQQETAGMLVLKTKFLDDVESGRRREKQDARIRQAEDPKEDKNIVQTRMQSAKYVRYQMLRAALQRSGLSEEEQRRELALASLGNLAVPVKVVKSSTQTG